MKSANVSLYFYINISCLLATADVLATKRLNYDRSKKVISKIVKKTKTFGNGDI